MKPGSLALPALLFSLLLFSVCFSGAVWGTAIEYYRPPLIDPDLIINPDILSYSNTIRVSGTATAVSPTGAQHGAMVQDTFGTDPASNPAFYLEFWTGGSVNYSYDLAFNPRYEYTTGGGPGWSVDPGETLTFNADLKPTVFSLTGSQSVSFGTDLNIFVDAGWFGEYDLDTAIPDINIGPVSLNLQGSGFDLTNTASGLSTDPYDNSPLLTTGTERMDDAWSVSFDIISALAYYGVPGAGILDGWPIYMDLDLYAGMDINRWDSVQVLDWNLDFDPLTAGFQDQASVTIPGTYSDGDVYVQNLPATLSADLFFYSQFLYNGEFGLEFDMGFGVDPQTLFEFNSDNWYVGACMVQTTAVMDIMYPVAIEVGDIAMHFEEGTFRPELPSLWENPYIRFTGLGESEIQLADAEINVFVDPETIPAPEPSTFPLLLAGFAMLGAAVWRRQGPPPA